MTAASLTEKNTSDDPTLNDPTLNDPNMTGRSKDEGATERSILIVEDEPIVQLHLQLIVAEAGHRVSATASSAQEAFEAAESEPPELVLMDIQLLGDVDGIAAARILSDTYDCPVIFTTAHTDAATVARTREIGPSGYITKPFTSTEVRAAIGTAFASHDRMKAAEKREHSLVSILRTLDEGILTTNEHAAISFSNLRASQLTGWDAHDAIDQNLFDVMQFASPADDEAFRSASALSQSTRHPQSLPRISIVGRDGAKRVVAIDIEPTRNHGDQISGLVLRLRESSAPLRAAASTDAPLVKIPFGRGTRLLVYSHDTFGLGHLQRSSNLIRALLARNPGLSVLLVTGSSVAHRFDLPAGADYVKLPAVRKVGSDRYEARSLAMPDSGVMTLRSNLLFRTVRDYEPDVLLVDHSPTGMNDEMLPTLEMLKRTGGCTTLLGLRDIIDDPADVIKLWKEKRIYDVLRNLYDHVLVYGSQSVYDTAAAYEFPDDVVAKTFFANYVCDKREPDEELSSGGGAEPLVAVSIGGGDGGADAVIGTYLDMLEKFWSEINFRSEIVFGPLLPLEAQERFRKRALGLPVSVQDFVPSTTPLFRSADLVVSTGGYNTVTQLLSHARRALIVPRVLHRQEQLIRGRHLAELGLVNCIHPKEINPQRMFDAIRSALDSDDQPLARAREKNIPSLDGADRVAEFCSHLLVAGQNLDRGTQ
jgi:PAS domain S-box-containing protein